MIDKCTITDCKADILKINNLHNVTRGGKKWKKKLEEPAWKLRPDAGPDKECDDDTEGELLIISPKIFGIGKKRKRSDVSPEVSLDVAVKRPKQTATREIVMDSEVDVDVEAQGSD